MHRDCQKGEDSLADRCGGKGYRYRSIRLCVGIEGIPTLLLSIPAKYMHTTVEMVSLMMSRQQPGWQPVI